MLIDTHIHVFPDALAERAIGKLAQNAHIVPTSDGTVKSELELLRQNNVDIAFALNIATRPTQVEKVNDFAISIQSPQIVAFGSIHPDYAEFRTELDRIKKAGLIGVKFHPEYQDFEVDEKRMYPIYEYCAQLSLAMVFHCGKDAAFPNSLKCSPKKMAKMVTAMKGATIICAHLGGNGVWEDAAKYVAPLDVYLDTSVMMDEKCTRQDMARVIEAAGVDKILFATDTPWSSYRDEIALLESVGLTKQEKDKIYFENAMKLLKKLQ